MALRVVLRPDAKADLNSIFNWVEQSAGPEQAHDYVRQIRRHYLDLRDFPNRGTDRSDLAPGLRTLAFKRRAIITYRVEENAILVDGDSSELQVWIAGLKLGGGAAVGHVE